MKFRNIVATYADRLRAFRPNARLYLVYVILAGAAIGVFRLLFNFYVVSLGYDEAFLGNLLAANNLTALLMALPMGYLADYWGRKASLLISSLGVSVAVLAMVLWHSAPVFVAMNVLLGLSQALAGISMGPFLMENSGEKERTYLFSFSSGLQMASASVGNWLGGSLPAWIAGTLQVLPGDSYAYGLAMLVVSVGSILSALPLLFLRKLNTAKGQKSAFAPISYFSSHPVLLGKLILPMLVTSIGAGLIMPFMNVFYRQVYLQPDQAIGIMFAWGSLAMGVGLMLAPPLADRMGKIQLVVISQALSIPFLALMGFSPWFALSAVAYYIRLVLMNMSGPVYQTFVMEQVDLSASATVASLVSMANNFGWAFSPAISGWIQVGYGFGPAFFSTIVLYVISIFLYWRFFWRRKLKRVEIRALPQETYVQKGN